MNITYLLGAGASANALPVVKDIPERLIKFQNYIEENFPEDIDEKKKLCINIKSLLKTLANHTTIDTYAKELSHLNRTIDLLRLKSVLSVYFLWEQIQNGIDKRYNSFLTKVLTNNNRIPENIKILTWNYDIQLEMAMNVYTNAEYIIMDYRFSLDPYIEQFSIVAKSLCSFPCHHMDIENHDLYKIEFIRLNGIAGSSLYTNPTFGTLGLNNPPLLPINMSLERKKLFTKEILRKYESLKQNTFFNFAWEKENEISKKAVKKAIEISQQTEILVVIGYSFPDFNWEIDKSILGEMKRLKRVYVQDINPDGIADVLKDFFSSGEGIDINPDIEIVVKSINTVNEFHIPRT